MTFFRSFSDMSSAAARAIVRASLLGLSVSGGFAHAQKPDAAPALEALSLRAAETLFQERSRELQAARRAIEGADADIITAGARPNPNLSISTSSISRTLGSGSLVNKRIDTIVGLSQVFERGNKAALRTETAQSLATAVRGDQRDVERTQRVVLHGAYYDLLQAQEKTRITNETAALFQKSVDALNIRLKAGDVAAVDVSRMSVDALRARNDARGAQADFEKAQSALAYLIGADNDAARLRAADTWPALEKIDLQGADAVINVRPDVQAAQARVAAADKNRDLARALRTRDVTAGAQIERFPGSDPRNSVGFSVSVPLFTRYYYDGEVRRAEVDYDAANDNLQRTRAVAIAEIRKAASDVSSSAERVQRLREVLLAAAEKAAQGAEFAYSRGAIGVMDVLDARRQLTATRLEAVAVQTDYAKALAAWRAAITAQGTTKN
jgi:outer membrane protein, heavy metal efflux system